MDTLICVFSVIDFQVTCRSFLSQQHAGGTAGSREIYYMSLKVAYIFHIIERAVGFWDLSLLSTDAQLNRSTDVFKGDFK